MLMQSTPRICFYEYPYPFDRCDDEISPVPEEKKSESFSYLYWKKLYSKGSDPFIISHEEIMAYALYYVVILRSGK